MRAMMVQAHRLAYFGLEFGGDVGIFFQEVAGILAALANTLALVAEPGAGFFYNIVQRANVEQVAHARDTLAVHNVELSLAEGRGGLVLYDFNFRARAHHVIALFYGGDAADIDAHR